MVAVDRNGAAIFWRVAAWSTLVSITSAQQYCTPIQSYMNLEDVSNILASCNIYNGDLDLTIGPQDRPSTANTLSLDTGSLQTVSGYFNVSGNSSTGTRLSIFSPSLMTVEGTLAMQSLGLVNFSLPSLTTAGSVVVDNVGMMTLELPVLSEVSGNLTIINSPELKMLSMPKLQKVDALDITGNPILDDLSLPSLSDIETALSIGDLSSNLTLPALTDTRWDNMRMQAGEMLNCTFNPSNSSQAPSCTSISSSGNSTTPSQATGTSRPTKRPTGLSTDAKIGIGVGLGVGIPLLLGVLIFCLVRARGRRRSSQKAEIVGTYSTEEPRGTDHGPASSPTRYSKVPSEMVNESRGSEGSRPVSALLGHDGTARADRAAGHEELVELEEQQGLRHELEEQQGVRHEMDARSLPDIDLDDDDEADTRSLEDIERSHGEAPTAAENSVTST